LNENFINNLTHNGNGKNGKVGNVEDNF